MTQILAKKPTLASLIIPLVIIFDQVTKALVLATKSDVACNSGFAFGIVPGFLNGFIALLVLLTLIYLFIRETKFVVWFGLALVIGGGVSNIIDRFVRGCVIDFIDFGLWPSLTRFPAFNLADGAITVGVAIIICWLIKGIFSHSPNS